MPKWNRTVGVTVTKSINISIRIDTSFVYIHVPVIRSDDEQSLGSIEVTSSGWNGKCVLVVVGDVEDITEVKYSEIVKSISIIQHTTAQWSLYVPPV